MRQISLKNHYIILNFCESGNSWQVTAYDLDFEMFVPSMIYGYSQNWKTLLKMAKEVLSRLKEHENK